MLPSHPRKYTPLYPPRKSLMFVNKYLLFPCCGSDASSKSSHPWERESLSLRVLTVALDTQTCFCAWTTWGITCLHLQAPPAPLPHLQLVPLFFWGGRPFLCIVFMSPRPFQSVANSLSLSPPRYSFSNYVFNLRASVSCTQSIQLS